MAGVFNLNTLHVIIMTKNIYKNTTYIFVKLSKY